MLVLFAAGLVAFGPAVFDRLTDFVDELGVDEGSAVGADGTPSAGPPPSVSTTILPAASDQTPPPAWSGTVAWASCSVIVGILPGGGPVDGSQVIDQALGDVERITGIRFTREDARSAMLEISWGEPDPNPHVAGRTTTHLSGAVISSAEIELRSDLSGNTLAVVRHEVAHAIGVDHSDRPADIMYPSLSPENDGDFSPADVAALTGAGRRAGCHA